MGRALDAHQWPWHTLLHGELCRSVEAELGIYNTLTGALKAVEVGPLIKGRSSLHVVGGMIVVVAASCPKLLLYNIPILH